jgi:penicillin amidase
VKLLKRLLLVLAAMLLVGMAVSVIRLRRSVPPLGGSESLPGLGAAVTVRFDSLGIPHIAAASDSDAFRALGYLHARDRLWQMETLRRAAFGRLSEVFGGVTFGTDRFLRSLDIRRAVDGSLALLPPATLEVLDAYLGGVNAWIAAPTRPLPPEFQVLRFRPEPWTRRDVVGVARIMAWDLAAANAELGMARARALVGPDRIVDLMPHYPADAPVTLAPGTYEYRRAGVRTYGRAVQSHACAPVRLHACTPARPYVPPSAALLAADVPDIPPLAAQVLSAVAMTRASNAWVIGPARSRSGKPILANDPHLELRAPALWYLVAIESPSYQVAGATIAGLPPVILGHNRRIAWGWTNLEADDVDYVIERMTPDSSQVLTASGLEPVEVVHDTIRVRNAPPVPFDLRRTPHGPLVPRAGVAGPPQGGMIETVAMRWTAHTPSDELTAILALDRANDWASFLEAARGLRSPEQNWVYADVDGNIGYTATGRIPVRRSGNGMLPTPGWTDEGAWVRFLDFEELPRSLNPPEGFIVTANNRVAGPEYPWMFTADFATPYRIRRIREMLSTGGPFSADDVQRMQMDTLDLFARALKELAAASAERAGFEDRAVLLRAWDGTAGADREEPTLFYTWYRALQRLTFEDDLGGPMTPSSRLHAWLFAGASPWFDDTRTREVEDLPALAERAMREAVPISGRRRWGEVHATISRHALGGARPLDVLFRLNVGPSPRAGSLYTVNVGGFSALTPPFTNTDAASLRHVVDLADPETGRFIVTSGSSGNPLGPHYRDQFALWFRGELAKVPIASGRVATAAVLRLEPAGVRRNR